MTHRIRELARRKAPLHAMHEALRPPVVDYDIMQIAKINLAPLPYVLRTFFVGYDSEKHER
jgi:hypothetical protein